MARAADRLEHAAGALRAELARAPLPRWLVVSRFGVDFLETIAPRQRPFEVGLLDGGRLLVHRLALGSSTALALDLEVERGGDDRHDAFDEALPVLLAGRLGMEGVVLLLAAGGLPGYAHAPAIAAIRDWIRVGDEDPLRALDAARLGARFPELRGLARTPELAVAAELLARHGEPAPAVAVARRGPSGPTDSELRAWRSLGGDLLVEGCGAEIVAARHQGLASVALALVLDRADAVEVADPGALASSAAALLPRLAALMPELLHKLEALGARASPREESAT